MTMHQNELNIKIIGCLMAHTPDQNYTWFSDTYTRVMNEVSHTGEVIHFVRYGSRHIQFTGVEVEQITDIPDGMLAWELCDDSWTVRQVSGEITWQVPITWQWRTVSDAGRWLGEFSARCPEEWGGGLFDFQITANSYLKRGEPIDDNISLVDNDPAWPQQYSEFASWLGDILGAAVALRIEHYGSTAIPGIPAKPIIDVLVQVPSFDIARQAILPLLNREEWEYWWYEDHMVFIKRLSLMGIRTHHIHLAPSGHRVWEGIAFRDYLRIHPAEAALYAALKGELAGKYREDREGYTVAKTAFVQEIITKALQTMTKSEETSFDGMSH